MNLSDPSDDEFSSDESTSAAKRPRADTLGASSTTSHGSALQEVEDEPLENNSYNNHYSHEQKIATQDNIRLSRSSLSENCSSPNEQYYDEFRPGFEENNTEGDGAKASFHDGSSNSFYHKNTSDNDKTQFEAGYSDKAKRMMSNMGFKLGKGLGKFEHGRTVPVEAAAQSGRRGLGMKPSEVGAVSRDFKWTPDDAKPEAKETVSWMPTSPEGPPSLELLEEWLQTGPKNLNIEDATDFVDPVILKGVLEAKTIFDSLSDEDLRDARFRSNPYETIGSVIFLNRAAVKMANLDAVFDFMFTKPKKPNGESAVDRKEILYFADVCAGPGGFSEYVLYRRGWRAKGFGFTLRGQNDFKLSDFYAGSPETFNPYYGVEGDGDIYNPANLASLKEHVLTHTEGKGVHFLMADGGFSVEGQENVQELVSKQLYVCQALAALQLLRPAGHLLVKLFDVFSACSVGLVYIMYRCFERVSIHKPVTSRPANSERYLVCAWKRPDTSAAERHLRAVNAMLWRADPEADVTQLVAPEVLKGDKAFFEYMYNSNCEIGERQIKNLLKIAAFSKDKSLREASQAIMRADCLRLWQIPDQVRTQPERLSPDETLARILSQMTPRPPEAQNLHQFKTTFLSKPPDCLEKPEDLDVFKNVYDWQCMFLSSDRNSPDLRLFLGCGGRQVYQLEGARWRSLPDPRLTLPPRSLLYGEIVKEYRGEGLTQVHSKALHVIDALALGGRDVSQLSLAERLSQCALFCAALDPADGGGLRMRVKRAFPLEQLDAALGALRVRAMKRVRRAVTARVPPAPPRAADPDAFYMVESMLFIKEVKEPWSAQMSRSSGHKYYFTVEARRPRSEYAMPAGARLEALAAYARRRLWAWPAPAATLAGRAPGLCPEHFRARLLDAANR